MRLPTIVLLLSSTLWGLSWLPLKALSAQGVHWSLLIFLSYGAMALLVVPWAWRSRRLFSARRAALLAIFVAGGLANICFNYALVHGEVVRAMVLFYLLPVWGVLGGRWILKERTSVWRWCGVGLAVGGAFILLGGPRVLAQPPGWADLTALLSGIFFAATIMLFRALDNVPLQVKLAALFFGCTFLAGVLVVTAAPIRDFPAAPALLWTVGYGATWLLLANLGSQWASTVLPAGRTAILMVMELVAAVLSAIWIGGETLTWEALLGGGLIISATVVEIVDAFREGRRHPYS